MAVLPGKDTLQPLATVNGLVRSAASARAEAPSPSAPEPSGRRRGGRGGRGSRGGNELIEVTPVLVSLDDEPAAPRVVEAPLSASEGVSRRHDPELVAVSMDDDQEFVYGWMGLNPTLLLESPPAGDNVVVRVVRPGVSEAAVLDAARQQLSGSGSRRRRRGGRSSGEGGGAVRTSADFPSDASAPVAVATADTGTDRWSSSRDPGDAVMVEITPLPIERDRSPAVRSTVIETTVLQVPVTRSVGRAAAAVSITDHPAAGAVVQTEPELPPDSPAADPADDPAGEPRRRRRRSSAAV